MPAGLHIVTKRKAGKPQVHYVYAWRGGPCIQRSEGPKPKITAALTDLAADARQKNRVSDDGTLAALIESFRASPEWQKLAKSTKSDWGRWLDRIATEFGKCSLRMFGSRTMRGEVLDWRDRFAATPRAADLGIQAFSRLLGWAVDRGKLATNILSGVNTLYESDRSDIIWEPQHFEAFRAKATPEVMDAVDLAAATGLRRGDLVKLPWSAVGEHAIVWKTSKSRGRTLVTIPLMPETKALLARIKARQEAAMQARRRDKRKPLPETVLSSSYLRSWTATGLGSRFNDFKQESGIDVHLHDLRGTFATRCMIAGLTDQEIADILGWDTKDVAAIRVKYVDQARVVIAIGERISRAVVNRV